MTCIRGRAPAVEPEEEGSDDCDGGVEWREQEIFMTHRLNDSKGNLFLHTSIHQVLMNS